MKGNRVTVRATRLYSERTTWRYTNPTERERNEDRRSGDVPVRLARLGGAMRRQRMSAVGHTNRILNPAGPKAVVDARRRARWRVTLTQVQATGKG